MTTSFDARKLIVSFAEKNVDVPSLQFIRDDPDGIDYRLIEGQGIVNYVFVVNSADKKSSVAIKYAEESMRMLPEEKLSLDRQDLEYNCLQLMNKIQPGSAPEPLCLDKQLNILAMADMSEWELLGAQLERRYIDMAAAYNLGHLLGKVHKCTTKGNVTEEEWTDLQIRFEQEDVKNYIGELTFHRPLVESDPLNKVPQALKECHGRFVKEMTSGGLLEKLTKSYSSQTCFIHADCHYKSIFVKEGNAALFDFEFACLGHPAFNLAFPIACYLMCYMFDEAHATPEQLNNGYSVEEFKVSCIQAIRNIVEGYLKVQDKIAADDALLSSFIEELALFIGIILAIVGIFAVMEAIVDNLTDVDRCRVFKAGFELMKNHGSIRTIDSFMKAMSM